VNNFAEIIINRKFKSEKMQTLTYAIPQNISAQEGQFVEIPLRNSKLKGLIFYIHQNKPSYPTKNIIQIIEKAPHLNSIQLKLLKHISKYYFTSLTKSLKLFVPPNFFTRKKLQIPPINPNPEPQQLNKSQLILSDEQTAAIKKIKTTQQQTILIHGITGSGKTEIYRRLAKEALTKNKQVLILIPEISLTPQTVNNFQKQFGKNIAIFHSHLTPKQKEIYWHQVRNHETGLIIGSRSAIFAPFKNLGLIIIDEEHEDSYKQNQSPRYHVRDLAIWLAENLNIKVILGSATPSIESYSKAKNGQYGLIEMHNRVGNRISNQVDNQVSNNEHNIPNQLPSIKIIDLREEMKKRNYSIFSEYLQQRLKENLIKKEQSILFLNRRGAASAMICRDCGESEMCSHCDITLTYHKKILIEDAIMPAQRLICHHCGRIYKIPLNCQNCGSHAIKYIGVGTQKIEEEVLKLFPQARILRADRDTTRKAGDFEQIYNQFKNQEADILIGTQMIGKGLHLPNVTLVGIILADLSLTIPDFRSGEKTFQLLTQVAGRSGRNKPGEVIIQTYQPEHYSIVDTLHHDYQNFYNHEIHHRRETNLPPYSRFLKLTISTCNYQKTYQISCQILEELQKYFAENPTESLQEITSFPALITKLKNKYRWHILLTGPNPRDFFEKFYYTHTFKNDIKIDVDPLSTI